jgi:cytochrome c oxidase cbb3-type subunit III
MSTSKQPGKQPDKKSDKKSDKVETTGHVWDANLQEYDNPLPRWWLWGFYATVVFAVVYWLVYPAWPIGGTFTKGLNTITFISDGEEVTTHWNTRSLLARDMQTGRHAVRQGEMLQRVGAMDYDAILADVDAMSFVNAYAKGTFGTWCAACHQTGAGGVIGQYPNLRNDQWLWGGTVDQIEQTLIHGRNGYMPPFRESLNREQLDQVASYVLALNGYAMNEDAVAAGEAIFTGPLGGCFQCHGLEADGEPSIGAPNLKNNLWGLVDVPGAANDAERVTRVARFVHDGVQRQMPAFGGRLSPTEIKVLTAYVHSLGGGQ